MLDLGGDVGALLVELDSMPPSGELEACPTGRPPADRFHTGVHRRARRDGGDGDTLVALFPAVRAGVYDVLDAQGRAVLRVHVAGGAVTNARLDGRPHR